jgi:ribosomal-protein-alanine N-acetyltransferase
VTGTGALTLASGSPADLDAVMAVMTDSFDASYGEAWTAPQCAGILPMPGVWLVLARRGEAVAGFTLGRIVLREAELLLLAVKRGEQGQGVGKLLLNRFMSDAAERGATHFHLEVRDGNHALKLYHQAGFKQVGLRKNYYCGSDGAVFHALTLSRSVQD